MIYLATNLLDKKNYEALRHYFANHYCSEYDILFVLGDSGLFHDGSSMDLDIFYPFPKTLLITGENDNLEALSQFPITTIFGAKARYLCQNVYQILPGEIVDTHRCTFLCLNEKSIDKKAETKLARTYVRYVLSYYGPSRTPYSYNDEIRWFYVKGQSRGKDKKKLGEGVLELPIRYLGKGENKGHLFSHDYKGTLLNCLDIDVPTRLKDGDLPEWYYHQSCGYGDAYYDVKDIKDLAFHGSPCDNHIDKDSSIYVAFDKAHPKYENLYPKNKSDYAYSTWRISLISFLEAVSKYSPRIDLKPIKAQINLVYDQYVNNTRNYHNGYVNVRPYPEVKTPRFMDKFHNGEACYIVTHGAAILAAFIKLETAQEYSRCYLKGNLRLKEVVPLASDEHNIERFESGDPAKPVCIRPFHED